MNLETLLREHEYIGSLSKDKDVDIIPAHPKDIRQRSDKGASLNDFIRMVAIVVELAMPDVKFEPDEGKVMSLDAMQNFDQPIITYSVIDRKTKKELKPRIREQVLEKDVETNEERVAEIWGQKFECLVQFNVFASVYKQAEEVMEKFEEIIIKHTGFFKRNGVAEIFFDRHLTDSHFDTMRESLSIRNLRYYVEIEKLTVMFKEKINQIEILAQKKKDEEEI